MTPSCQPPGQPPGPKHQKLPSLLRLHSYAASIRKAVLASMDNENVRLLFPRLPPTPWWGLSWGAT